MVMRRLDRGFRFPDRSGWFVDEEDRPYLVDLIKVRPVVLSPSLTADSNVTFVTRLVYRAPEVSDDAVVPLERLTRAAFYIRRRADNAPVAHLSDRRTIRFFPDYGTYAALWDLGGLTSAKALGLSESHTRRIRAWYEHWEIHFAREMTWSTPEEYRNFVREGWAIVPDLSHEVRAFAVIEPRFEKE